MLKITRVRLDLRARVVLFTSAAVVIALFLLGYTLHSLLAKTLYGQQRQQALYAVNQATSHAAARMSTLAGLPQREVLKRVVQGIAMRKGPPQGFEAVVVVAPGGSEQSDDAHLATDVPASLQTRVQERSEQALVYAPAKGGHGRVLIVGTPIPSNQVSRTGPYWAYFFFPLTFQEDTLATLTQFLLVVGAGLLIAVVVLAMISIGRVLEPIRRARDVAEEITAGNLAARIPEATARDDFGRLAESFNRMTGALAQKIRELQEVSRLQARFVQDVSHELRTPLSTVRMAADYIHAARASLPTDAQRAAVLLERELERFENLLEDLLEISRFDAGVVVLEPVEVDLESVLDEVVDALDAIAHGHQVDLSLHVDHSNGPPVVAADPRRLDRVFSNLVKNAVEHTTERSVRVEVTRSDEEVVVRVIDEGEGIPAEDLPHIFERFYRADAHRARAIGGTGLGLAIALENVHLHRGSITVESQVGVGSTFTVVLPAAEPPGGLPVEEVQVEAAEPEPEAVHG